MKNTIHLWAMGEELGYDERREWAKTVYIGEDRSIKEVAATVGADEVTVGQWAQDGGWDGLKRSLLISKKNQLALFYDQLEKISRNLRDDPNPNAKDLDMMVKCTENIKNLEVGVSVSSIIEVFDLFIQWLKFRDLKLTKKLVVEFDTFIKERLAA